MGKLARKLLGTHDLQETNYLKLFLCVLIRGKSPPHLFSLELCNQHDSSEEIKFLSALLGKITKQISEKNHSKAKA